MISAPALKNAKSTDFFIPGFDKGVWLAKQENLNPKKTNPIDIKYHNLSNNILHVNKSNKLVSSRNVWKNGLEFPTALAVGENISMGNGVMTVNGKYIINSTGGLRVRIAFMKRAESPEEGRLRDADLSSYLHGVSNKEKSSIPLYGGDYKSMPYVIESRNFYNYYHFTKETLPNLALYKKYELKGEIFIFGKGNAINEFTKNLIGCWFPELLEKVSFIKRGAVKKFDAAVFPLNSQHLYTQNGISESLDDIYGSDEASKDGKLVSFVKSSYNSYESSLADFRNIATRKIALESSEKKLRIYIKRKSSRVRNVVGEDILLSRLKNLNFESISFEDYSIEDQAKLVSRCEALVSIHGAGLTNMMFAPKGCLVVELTNLQTLIGRMGDFNPLALVSEVRYNLVILDHDHDDPEAVPKITRDGHRGVVIDDVSANKISYLVGLSMNQP